MEEVQKSGVYINRSYQDKLVLYNKDLGSGKKKKNNDEKLYRIVPCATRLEVQTIATAVSSIRNRSSVVSKITKYRQKQASEKISTKLQMWALNWTLSSDNRSKLKCNLHNHSYSRHFYILSM